MMKNHKRVLIYSHDTFGLGHLRRCRTIGHSLVDLSDDISVLILSGSPIIGSFDFRSRVDFVRIPGVIKLRNGDYTSLNSHLDIEETLHMRSSIIEHTARSFSPDLFIVDKEPLGLRGEIESTLDMLKDQGVPLVLGLRDVLDDPELLAKEWARKKSAAALEKYYDELWVYGTQQMYNPLAGIELSDEAKERMKYVGYLRRDLTNTARSFAPTPKTPFVLVTPGGGGDGENLVDWVLRAYEMGQKLDQQALIVLGPFMNSDRQADFMERAEKLDQVNIIRFAAHMETLVKQADGIIAMGGYNTFCEVLSFDKRAVIVPREVPRREQFIRAGRAEEQGLVRMLPDDGVRDATRMRDVINSISAQPAPSASMMPDLLGGLENVNSSAARLMGMGDIKNEPASAAC